MQNSEKPFISFSDADILAHLSGFSGAKIFLMQSRGRGARFVRKVAKGQTAKQRLSDQKEKIMKISDLFNENIRLPVIFNEELTGDYYWYDMEFISGIDGISFLSCANTDKVDFYRKSILKMWKNSQLNKISESAHEDICKVIRKKISEINVNSENKFNDALFRIEEKFLDLCHYLQPTLCHGDMTLENMIFTSQGEVVLIDPIPAPLEHVWFDISKVFQDIEGRWFIHRKRSLPFGITAGIRDILLRDLHEIDPDYLHFHSIMLALCFARVLPYCNSREDEDFVLKRISSALESRIGKLRKAG